MIVSINWLKQFTDIIMPIDELASHIGARLVEIESIIDLGAKYKDVIIASVMTCEDLSGSDHLHVCTLDDGGVIKDIPRNDSGHIQVVCGAPNVRAGLMVAWLPPGSTVPQTYGTDDPFVLDARKLRGVMSYGMIASATELGLYEDPSGILELGPEAELGASFTQTYSLDDYLLDIENKSLTHRPDCFGVIGFAREVAAIQGVRFNSPEWFKDAVLPQTAGDTSMSATVKIDNPELCDRYQAALIDVSSVSSVTPLHIKTMLSRVGIRPISFIVDVTNYLMIETGQPLHAFDYDKVIKIADSADIHVRAGREGETLVLLDGRELKLTGQDIVIAANQTPIALAGAMGGADTEIDSNTTRIILESASFNLYNLRATQMRHGIFSEAITRFTKGQPARLTQPSLVKALSMLDEVKVCALYDEYPDRIDQKALPVSRETINGILGTELSDEEIVSTLVAAEFEVQQSDGMLEITAPWWRKDINIKEDVAEEVGRLRGFDEIIPSLPGRDFTAVQLTEFDQLTSRIRNILARAGANEVLTYSFVHGDVLRKANQNPDNSYRIVNSLSPDLQYYRQSLTPSLLNLVHANSKAGYDHFALFELNKTHVKKGDLDDGVPPEMHRLAFVRSNRLAGESVAYYDARATLEYVAQSLGLSLSYTPIENDVAHVYAAPFDISRSAMVRDTISGHTIGIVGEYRQDVAKKFKLPESTAGFELLTEAILLARNAPRSAYEPSSRFPSVERDVCYSVSQSVRFGDIFDAAHGATPQQSTAVEIVPVDIYRSSDSDRKHVTLRYRITSHDGTLHGDDAAKIVNAINESVCRATDARIV